MATIGTVRFPAPDLTWISPLLVVHAATDVEHAAFEINVLPLQATQLAAPQPRVERGRPQGTVGLAERADQLLGLARSRDPITASLTRG